MVNKTLKLLEEMGPQHNEQDSSTSINSSSKGDDAAGQPSADEGGPLGQCFSFEVCFRVDKLMEAMSPGAGGEELRQLWTQMEQHSLAESQRVREQQDLTERAPERKKRKRDEEVGPWAEEQL